MPDKERHNSFEDIKFGVGQNTDGSFNIFPASELPRLLEERKRQEEATAYAIEQSEKGSKDDAKPTD